jgi:hypothetical protein
MKPLVNTSKFHWQSTERCSGARWREGSDNFAHHRVAPLYDYALQTMQDLPYGKWREYEPEDTVRFYALRLHELGMITSSPQKIIAQRTDWRFLTELKQELKG